MQIKVTKRDVRNTKPTKSSLLDYLTLDDLKLANESISAYFRRILESIRNYFESISFLHEISEFLSDYWNHPVIFDTRQWVSMVYEKYTNFFCRIRYFGVGRFLGEFVSESLTSVLLISFAFVTLSNSAMQETNDTDWKSTDVKSIDFFDRQGRYLGTRKNRIETGAPAESYPDHLLYAVIVEKDQQFLQHSGFKSMGAMFGYGSELDGVSISQNVVREMFLSDDIRPYSTTKEFFLVLWLEITRTKKEIIKEYLDRSYFGFGKFGIGVASRFYFDKSVDELTLSESAMLVSTIDSPFDNARHLDLIQSRRNANEVLNRMFKEGFLTMDQIEIARRNPANLVHRPVSYTPDNFLDYAFKEFQNLIGNSKDDNFKVMTTLDLGLQREANSIFWNNLHGRGRNNGMTGSALVSMEPDGAVCAIVGIVSSSIDHYNPATEIRHDAGTYLKPLVFASAIDGLETSPDSNENDETDIEEWVQIDKPPKSQISLSDHEEFSGALGSIPKMLLTDAKMENIVETIGEMGIPYHRKFKNSRLDFGTEGAVLDIASAYSVLGNGGYKVKPYSILEIYNGNGEKIWDMNGRSIEKHRILSEESVYRVNNILTGKFSALDNREKLINSYRIAGKSGKSKNNDEIWTIGYSGNLTTIVWLDSSYMGSIEQADGDYDISAKIWWDFMEYSLSKLAPRPIPGVNPTDLESEFKETGNERTHEIATQKDNSEFKTIMTELKDKLEAISIGQ